MHEMFVKCKKSKKSKVLQMKEISEDKFIVSVKVGPKGQITIPAIGRKMFDINEGDTLMVLGDKKRGIAILKDESVYSLMGGVFENDSNKDK